MSKGEPEPEPQEPSAEGSPNPQPAEAADPWPTFDPDAIGTASFMQAGDVTGGLVAVTGKGGSFAEAGAPGDQLAKLIKTAWEAIKDAGNLAFSPRAIAAVPVGSIAVVFGEPPVPPDQFELPVSPVWEAASRVAQLIPLDDEALFENALKLGQGAQGYVGLARLVQTAGITVEWEVRGAPIRVLTPDRAASQYENLTRPAQFRATEMQVTGLLYRAIFEARSAGKAAIHLAKGSPVPPQARGSFVVVRYQTEAVEELVLHNLLGKVVRATLRIEEPLPNTALKPELPPAELISIEETKLDEQMTLPEGWRLDDVDDVTF